MKKTLIKNIAVLVADERPHPGVIRGKEMQQTTLIQDAWLAAEDGIIADYGSMSEWPGISDWSNLEVIDAENGWLLPGWCDSHTHAVFAAPREEEFGLRLRGKTYEEIAASGGGILNSAKRLRLMSEEDLFQDAANRVHEIILKGTTSLEIKSGYGLSRDAELKMLRVIKRLKQHFPIAIRASFLGAHAMPPEYRENRKEYVDLLIGMIPELIEQELIDFIDVFCDRGFFTVEETERILEASLKLGIHGKIHANELDFSGGIQAGVKYRALSVDHLECTGDAEIECLLGSSTIATLLPSTAFFLNLHYPPARKMLDAGLNVALASDFNPGSSPSFNMPFVIALACTQMKMLPEEAFHAATINGAAALGMETTEGSIAPGKKANFILTKPMQSLASIPYSFGSNPVRQVVVNGSLYHD